MKNPKIPKCDVCSDDRWLICTRSEDGREAVERCDACQDVDSFFDEDAAVLARAAGVDCEVDYPCYLK